MKEFKIGLLGVDNVSENMGCQALTYALLYLIDEELTNIDRTAAVTLFVQKPYDIKNNLSIKLNSCNVIIKTFQFSKVNKLKELLKSIKEQDMIYDITGGDSFSDIYGLKRFLTWTFVKQYANSTTKSLILAPQTYGPYKSLIARIVAANAIKKSKVVVARDEKSFDYINKIAPDKAFLSTDTAFALPYERREKTGEIGINVSGLMLSGGYTGNNQFGLKLDYRIYIERVIEEIHDKLNADIVLIPHVICENYDSPENDVRACEEMVRKYNFCRVSPIFNNPIEAKSYISGLDLLIGSRMHATIAAFSSGVPVIPVAYSVKFEGLFESLNYPYYIDGRTTDTEKAIEDTMTYCRDVDKLKLCVDRGNEIYTQKLEVFKATIRKMLRGGE